MRKHETQSTHKMMKCWILFFSDVSSQQHIKKLYWKFTNLEKDIHVRRKLKFQSSNRIGFWHVHIKIHPYINWWWSSILNVLRFFYIFDGKQTEEEKQTKTHSVPLVTKDFHLWFCVKDIYTPSRESLRPVKIIFAYCLPSLSLYNSQSPIFSICENEAVTSDWRLERLNVSENHQITLMRLHECRTSYRVGLNDLFFLLSFSFLLLLLLFFTFISIWHIRMVLKMFRNDNGSHPKNTIITSWIFKRQQHNTIFM